MTVSLAINEILKWLSSLPMLMQESFWWWQCSDRYIISLSPHPRLHTTFTSLLPVPNQPYGFCGCLFNNMASKHNEDNMTRKHMSAVTKGRRHDNIGLAQCRILKAHLHIQVNLTSIRIGGYRASNLSGCTSTWRKVTWVQKKFTCSDGMNQMKVTSFP